MKKREDAAALASRAYALFEEFRAAYAQEWQRLEHAERMYCGDHWYEIPQLDPNEPRPVTPVIQSTVENIAADLMDALPEAVITPESPGDNRAARALEAVLRQNHDAACYAREYLRLTHDLLVGGYMVQEVGYDPAQNGGLGGAFIRHVDSRGVLFDPLCTDIQTGRAVFKFALRTREWLAARFPDYDGEGDGYAQAAAFEDTRIRRDASKTALLIEYWWRDYDEETGKECVHMAQLAGGKTLTDSRDTKPQGYYAHGQYPFIVTPLFLRKGSALGLGLVDMFGSQQQYADKLDQIVMKNALMASRNKLLITHGSGFDPDDLRDWSRQVHTGDSLSGVSWFATPPLPAYLLQYVHSMRENIKEESGSNDFSRGGAAGGVTAASAISALQEMSGKRSRMAIRQMHEAYRDAVRMEIEVEREFNILPRAVTYAENGELKHGIFDAASLVKSLPGGRELPVEFTVSIKVQKENRFSTAAQNQNALEMMRLGVIGPMQTLELMRFDGKEEVMRQARLSQKQGGAGAAGPASGIEAAMQGQAPAVGQKGGLAQKLGALLGRKPAQPGAQNRP